MGVFKVTDPDGSATARLEADLARIRAADRKRVDDGEMEQTEDGYTGNKK